MIIAFVYIVHSLELVRNKFTFHKGIRQTIQTSHVRANRQSIEVCSRDVLLKVSLSLMCVGNGAAVTERCKRLTAASVVSLSASLCT